MKPYRGEYMANYSITSGKLEPIKENPFELEKEIQTLTEMNLKLIFGLYFVKSEFALHNFRIDTLAFDPNFVNLLTFFA